MKISRNSMISVATAAVLMTGFTGCGSSDTNNVTEGATSTSSSSTVNQNEQAQYTAPIQGLVVDDRGQPVSGAKVTIGNQTTTTSDAGQYGFDSVDISTYVLAQLGTGNSGQGGDGKGGDGCEESCLLLTIQAPVGSDMNDVIVGVQPEMVHISDATDDYRGDTEDQSTGDQNVLANSQSFTINSQVGTAMLTHKAANVKAFIGMSSNGTPVAEGTKVIAVYSSVNNDESVDGSIPEKNYITSVNSVIGYTDADGMVTFNNLLTSSTYDLIVEGYTIFGSRDNIADNTDIGSIDDENRINGNFSTYVYQGYAANDYMANLGNVMVSPIINGDEINPLVATVLNQYGMAGTDIPGRGNRGVLMLQRTVTNTIEIMFTEAVEGDDIAQNVMVVAQDPMGNNVGFLPTSSVDLTGNKLTVTLANDLTDGQRFEVLLFRDTNLRDLAGNPLAFRDNNWGPEAADEGTYSPWIDLGAGNCVDGICEDASLRYLSCDVNGRAFVFDFMAYKELQLDAEGATGIVQMELDTDVVRTVDSDVTDLELYSNAFNNIAPDELAIDLPGHPAGPLDTTFATLQFNNVSGAFEPMWRLTELKQALLGEYGAHMNFVYTDAARIKFTAGKATVYEVTVPQGMACDTGNKGLGYIVTEGSCISDVAGTTKYLVSGFAEGDEIDLVLVGDAFGFIGDYLAHGDQVVITPVNDLCIPGTAATQILADNVAPTTVLQNSYIGGTIADGVNQIVPFGEGGELTNVHGVDSGMGVPALYVTPGLLDNLDANGNNILEANQFVTADETLNQELYVHNIADNNYTVAQKIYDATDYEQFITMLDRNVGVSFSENVDLTGVTPMFAGASVSGYTAVNNIGKDDADHNVSRDLVAFNTNNVLTLANTEDDNIMSFNGIKDLAGNAADHAYVKVLDGMPPFITRAVFDGQTVVVTFNEPIQLIDGSTSPLNFQGSVLSLPSGGGVAMYDQTTSPATWTLDTTGTILTVPASEFSGSVGGAFGPNNQYDESALYGLPAGDYRHTRLQFHQIQDLDGNSWANWCRADTDLPQDIGTDDDSVYAYADLECGGRNAVKSPSFAMISNIGDFDVEVDNAGFFADDSNASQTVVWNFSHPIVTGAGELFNAPGTTLSEPASAALIDTWFEYVHLTNAAVGLTTYLSDVSISLDATAQIMTLTFHSPSIIGENDVIRNVGTQVFTSDIAVPTETESVSASANAAP